MMTTSAFLSLISGRGLPTFGVFSGCKSTLNGFLKSLVADKWNDISPMGDCLDERFMTYRGASLIKTAPSQDLTVALCLGSYGGPTGGAVSYERGTPVKTDSTRWTTNLV